MNKKELGFRKILECLDVELKDFDIKIKVKKNPLKSKVQKIISHATDKELKYYVSVLESLQKCFKITK